MVHLSLSSIWMKRMTVYCDKGLAHSRPSAHCKLHELYNEHGRIAHVNMNLHATNEVTQWWY